MKAINFVPVTWPTLMKLPVRTDQATRSSVGSTSQNLWLGTLFTVAAIEGARETIPGEQIEVLFAQLSDSRESSSIKRSIQSDSGLKGLSDYPTGSKASQQSK